MKTLATKQKKKQRKKPKKANWEKFFEVFKALALLAVEILRRI